MSIIESLKTDYKDDVFVGNRKYKRVDNSDGSFSLDDVTEYIAEGTPFGALEANKMGEAYNSIRYAIPNDKIGRIVIPVNSFTAMTGVPEVDYPEGYQFGYLVKDDRIDELSIVHVDFSQGTINQGIMSVKGKAVKGGFYVYAAKQNKAEVVIERITVRNQSSVESVSYATQTDYNNLSSSYISLKSEYDKLKESVDANTEQLNSKKKDSSFFKDPDGYISYSYDDE